MAKPGPLLHDALADAADRTGERVALRTGEQAWTFTELDRRSRAWATGLGEAGVEPGDRVAVMMSNRPEFLVTVNAISRAGAACVLISPAWKDFEVDHALALTGAARAVTDGAATETMATHLGPDRVTDVDSSMIPTRATDAAKGPRDVVDPGDDAVLVFSSGTTGLPKAVRHSHATIVAATRQWVEALGLGPRDRFQVATPPSHILGLLNLLAAMSAGATVRLHKRFDLAEELACIESDRLTLEMAVAPIALAMANDPDLESHDLSSLRYIMWGATPVTPAVAAEVTRRTGVRWLPCYGASEVPVISCNPVGRPDDWRLDSAGLAAEGVELRVVDLETGATLEPGQTGEVQVRAGSVMVGYLPEEDNADAFVDGWYRTGDVGWLEPEGWVHLTDRSKEMIKVKGFQVAPAEIEAVLHGHPAVFDCAVFGVPDPQAGEVPIAAVQVDPARAVAADELEALVSTSLANYKRLHAVVFVAAIPRLASGKVLRRQLLDEWVAASAAEEGF